MGKVQKRHTLKKIIYGQKIKFRFFPYARKERFKRVKMFFPHDNVILLSQYSAVINQTLSKLNDNFNLQQYTFHALGEGLITHPEESYRVLFAEFLF
jgi:hypothetical protein